MRSYHILKRGNRYQYVCRVPVDLLHYFPCKTIYRSLKTRDVKIARVLAVSLEHETQGLFMKIRSRHLDEQTIRQLIVNYLSANLLILESQVKGKVYSTYFNQEKVLELGEAAIKTNNDHLEKINRLASVKHRLSKALSKIHNDPEYALKEVEAREAQLKADLLIGENAQSRTEVDEFAKKHNLTLTDIDHAALQKRLLNIDIKLALAEKEALRDSDWTQLEMLKAYLDKQRVELQPKILLDNVIKDYMAQYLVAGCTIKFNSLRAARRETEFILKTLGKGAELPFFNSKTAVKKLKTALSKKKKTTGEQLSDKSRSAYLSRLSSIVNHVIKTSELDIVNKISGTFSAVGTEKPRDSYSMEDMKCLENALCTVPILHGKSPLPRNDRFWIILIALLHGCRKSVIVNLKEGSIFTDAASKLVCFDFRTDSGPQDKTTIMCPIHPLLLRVGFLEWLDRIKTGNPDKKIFEDDPESFGQWWNGTDASNSWNRLHVTQNPKVTFHSLRHYFCTWTDELDVTEKLKNEMSGHAQRFVGDNVRTKHYLERTRASRMREVQEKSMETGKILMTDIDWGRLDARAKELFEL